MKIRLDDNAVEHVVQKALRRSLKMTKRGGFFPEEDEEIKKYRKALKVVLSWWEP